MENVLYIVIIILLVAAMFAWYRSRQLPADFPYQSQDRLLTEAEISLYRSIQQSLSLHRKTEDLIVFAKVRIADVINPGKSLDGNDWQDALGRISSKHFDYVICAAEDSQIRLLVELDDGNQRSVKKLRRDHFLDQVCASASLPLLRIPVQQGYEPEELWQSISTKLLRLTSGSEIETGEAGESAAFQQKTANQGVPGA